MCGCQRLWCEGENNGVSADQAMHSSNRSSAATIAWHVCATIGPPHTPLACATIVSCRGVGAPKLIVLCSAMATHGNDTNWCEHVAVHLQDLSTI